MKKQSITIRPSKERGHVNHGWLDSYFTFSFADYYDPSFMHFRHLRVINEDWIDPSQGFGQHPHQNMEIFTYVIEGALQHKDSMGHASVIKAGDVQKISAGKGISHSEFNASPKEKVHLLQIWILPKTKDIDPSYQEMTLAEPDPTSPLRLIGSPKAQENVVSFNQDVSIYRGRLNASASCAYDIKLGRGVWVQMVSGKIQINNQELLMGDGAAIENISTMNMKALEDAEFLLFDLS